MPEPSREKAFARAAGVGLLALGIAGFATSWLAPDREKAGAPSGVTLLYVGAEDCGPCRVWRREHKPGFLAGLNRARVTYREVIAARTAAAFDEASWPEDLHDERRLAMKVGGVPQWLVLREGRPVLAAGGLSQWQSRVLPLIRKQDHRT